MLCWASMFAILSKKLMFSGLCIDVTVFSTAASLSWWVSFAAGTVLLSMLFSAVSKNFYLDGLLLELAFLLFLLALCYMLDLLDLIDWRDLPSSLMLYCLGKLFLIEIESDISAILP